MSRSTDRSRSISIEGDKSFEIRSNTDPNSFYDDEDYQNSNLQIKDLTSCSG